MNQAILPILFVLAGIGLFVGYTNPTFQQVKDLQVQYQQYDAALTQSSQLRQMRDQLLSKRNTFPADGIQRLERLLPDNIDNIRLIIDVNNIASRYHLQVADIAFASVSATPQARTGGGVSPVGSVDLSFSVNATYSDFLAFLQDLQRSARLVDVEAIKFSVADQSSVNKNSSPTDAVSKYTVTVRTYWLKQ